VTIILGFFIANGLSNIRRGRGPLVFLYFAPYVANMAAFSSVFMYLYANTGLFNTILTEIGIPRMGFTRSITQALPSVALMDAWKHIGFDVVILLAALKNIPPHLIEAATIDGASPLQILFRVKLPLLRPTVLFLTVVIFIWTMQVFEPIYVMTSGGPANATTTVVHRIFSMAFLDFNMGYASAIAFILFAIILGFTLLQLRIGRTDWSY
jgi:multiple sugar transport system permease protein